MTGSHQRSGIANTIVCDSCWGVLHPQPIWLLDPAEHGKWAWRNQTWTWPMGRRRKRGEGAAVVPVKGDEDQWVRAIYGPAVPTGTSAKGPRCCCLFCLLPSQVPEQPRYTSYLRSVWATNMPPERRCGFQMSKAVGEQIKMKFAVEPRKDKPCAGEINLPAGPGVALLHCWLDVSH